MIEFFQNEFNVIWASLKTITFVDVLDIIIVAAILFYAYRFIRDRRAGKLAIGVLVLLLIMILANILSMHMLSYLLNNIFQVGILMVFILFQPEIRSFLEKVGSEPVKSLRGIGADNSSAGEMRSVIAKVSEAAGVLSREKTGALIVFKRESPLGDISPNAALIDAEVSVRLLRNLFFKNSPLHDGAVTISNGRISYAGCYLPVSSRTDIDESLGTRHRAALGMSENSDAVIVVVSEESGRISVVHEGKIEFAFSKEALERRLCSLLVKDTRPPRKRRNKEEPTDTAGKGE